MAQNVESEALKVVPIIRSLPVGTRLCWKLSAEIQYSRVRVRCSGAVAASAAGVVASAVPASVVAAPAENSVRRLSRKRSMVMDYPPRTAQVGAAREGADRENGTRIGSPQAT